MVQTSSPSTTSVNCILIITLVLSHLLCSLYGADTTQKSNKSLGQWGKLIWRKQNKKIWAPLMDDYNIMVISLYLYSICIDRYKHRTVVEKNITAHYFFNLGAKKACAVFFWQLCTGIWHQSEKGLQIRLTGYVLCRQGQIIGAKTDLVWPWIGLNSIRQGTVLQYCSVNHLNEIKRNFNVVKSLDHCMYLYYILYTFWNLRL